MLNGGTPVTPNVNKFRHGLAKYGEMIGANPDFAKVYETDVGEALLNCPSNALIKGAITYRFCVGTTYLQGNRKRGLGGDYAKVDGAFGINIGRREMEISDGFSNTACMAERVPGAGVNGRGRVSGEVFRIDFPLRHSVEPEEWSRQCELSSRNSDFAGISEIPHGLSFWQIYYTHFLTPNSALKDCWSRKSQFDAAFAARSKHFGGACVMFLDGRSQLVSSGIERAIWHAVGCADDGIIDPFSSL